MADTPKRLALVSITGATDTHCGECVLLEKIFEEEGCVYCNAHYVEEEGFFDEPEPSGNGFLRLPQCLAAEKEVERQQELRAYALRVASALHTKSDDLFDALNELRKLVTVGAK